MSHSYSSSAMAPRDPGMAATLSLLPGLGQLYNGESRKGILFMDVAAINFAILWLMVFNSSITNSLTELGKTYGMKLNDSLISTLHQVQFGTPGSFVILGLILSFVAFSVRDAHENASRKRRRALYGDSVIDLTEATSGSYIFHVSLLIALAVFALFFFIPKPAAKQITEIEFMPQKVLKQEKPRTDRVKALNNAADHGRVSKNNAESQHKAEHSNTPHAKAETKAQSSRTSKSEASKASSSSASSAQQSAARIAPTQPAPASSARPAANNPTPPQPQPMRSAAALPQPTPVARTAASAQPAVTPTPNRLSFNMPAMPVFSPKPSVQPMQSPIVPVAALSRNVAGMAPPSMLAPTSITASSSSAAVAVPHPASAKSTGTGFPSGFGGPSIHTAPIGGKGDNPAAAGGGPAGVGPSGFARSPGPSGLGTAPTMVAATGGPHGTGTSPVPRDIGSGTGTGKHGTFGTSGPGILPSRSRGNNDGSGNSGPVIVPTSGPALASTGPGISPRKDTDDRPSQREAVESPDFGPYMADLQRRIKKAWFPARADLSHRVVVVFKIHADGSCTNVMIKKSSGIARHDQTAVSAVENAAPFPPLPKHSPEVVDIEFTFDYNVFSGR